MSRVLRILVLGAIWVALWAEISVANVVWGLVVAIGVTLAFGALEPPNDNGIRPIAAARFAARFAVMLVRSTWSVVVEVLRPELALAEAIVAVPLHTHDPVIITMVANGITLTPGTLTVDLGPEPGPGEERILYVHALKLTSADDIIAGAHALEALATAAFPPPSPLADPTAAGTGADETTAGAPGPVDPTISGEQR